MPVQRASVGQRLGPAIGDAFEVRVAQHDVRGDVVARGALLAPRLQRVDELGLGVGDVGAAAAGELGPAAVELDPFAVGDHDARAARLLEHRRVGAQLDDRTGRSRERDVRARPRRRACCVPGSASGPVRRGARAAPRPVRAARASRSSSRNGRRAVASAMTCTAVSPRVIATWKMRRSSSMSSASACGISPSCAPSTTTYGHSMPFTRCTVDSATPSLRGRLVRRRAARSRSHGSNAAGIGFEGGDRDRAR